MKKLVCLYLLVVSIMTTALERIVLIENQSPYQLQLFNHHTHELQLSQTDTIAPNNTGTILPSRTIIPVDIRVPWTDIRLGMRHQYLRIIPIIKNQQSPWIAFIGALNGQVHALVRKRGESINQARHMVAQGPDVQLVITQDSIALKPAIPPQQQTQTSKQEFIKALGSHAYTALEGEAYVTL